MFTPTESVTEDAGDEGTVSSKGRGHQYEQIQKNKQKKKKIREHTFVRCSEAGGQSEAANIRLKALQIDSFQSGMFTASNYLRATGYGQRVMKKLKSDVRKSWDVLCQVVKMWAFTCRCQLYRGRWQLETQTKHNHTQLTRSHIDYLRKPTMTSENPFFGNILRSLLQPWENTRRPNQHLGTCVYKTQVKKDISLYALP